MRGRTERFLAIPAAIALAFGCGPANAPNRPDVLLVTIDTLRADHVGAYGAGDGTTPHLDALAAQGVVFLRALAASSRTAPAHASLFTSRWVRDHAIGYRNGATRLGEETTLAAILAAEGYRTAAIVSNSMLRRRIGLDRGFASYDDELPDAEPNRPVYERLADKTTERAIALLAGSRTEPLFLWVHYNDPHGPYRPPPAFVEAADASGEPPLPVLDIQRGIGGIPAYQAVGGERHPAQYRARYAGEIRYLDASLGRLLEAFDASVRAPAIAIVTSDHGESLGERGVWFSHGFATTPDLAHVPFVLRAPGLAPARVSAPVHHVDLLPTLLELLRLPVPPRSAGIALGPVLRGEAAMPERDLFVDVGSEVSAYRGDLFVRARFGEDLAGAESGSRDGFRWDQGGGWQAVVAPPDLSESAVRHADARAPLRFAPELDALDEARLRALGYLEPEEK